MLNFNLYRRWRLRRLLRRGDKLHRSTKMIERIQAYDNYIKALEYTKDIIYLDKDGAITNLYHALSFTVDVPYDSAMNLLNDASRMLDLLEADVAIRKDSLVQLNKKRTIPLNEFLIYSNRFSILVFIELSISLFKHYRNFLVQQPEFTKTFEHYEYNHRILQRRIEVLWFINALILATCSNYELVFKQEEENDGRTK